MGLSLKLRLLLLLLLLLLKHHGVNGARILLLLLLLRRSLADVWVELLAGLQLLLLEHLGVEASVLGEGRGLLWVLEHGGVDMCGEVLGGEAVGVHGGQLMGGRVATRSREGELEGRRGVSLAKRG
jgi:hypothetical protein